MATPSRKSAASSRSFRPINSAWESVLIQWANNNRSDLHGTTLFPFVAPKGDKRIQQATFFDKFPLKESETGYKYTPVEELLQPRPKRYIEEIASYKPIESGSDHTRVAESENERIMRWGIQKTKEPTKGLVCTSVTQWVRVEVKTKTPTSEQPPLRIWAFLQPAQIGSTKGAVAGHDQHCPDDFPRSGWAEYHVLPGGKSCMRKDWDEGKSVEHELAASHWNVEKIDGNTFVYKIQVEVKNQRTAGDLARWKQRNDKYRPEIDSEAGCWLKVWVRDEAVDWGLEPADDEANTLLERMDAMDPPSGPDILNFNRALCAHAYLRERLFVGPEDPKKFDKAGTAYVVLFNDIAMGHLVELNKLLRPPKPSLLLASQTAASVAALLGAASLRLLLEEWQKATPTERPADLPAGIEWPDALNKRKAVTFIKVVESLDLSSGLAVLAADGFAHNSLEEAKKSANPDLVMMWSKIYGAIFDFALADGPSHYREFCMGRLDKRQALLKQRIQYNAQAAAQIKAHEGKKAEEEKKRKEALDAEAQKSKGLGLLKTTQKSLGWAKSVEGTKVSIKVGEASWGGGKHSIPKPAGAPLPIPGIPLVWSFTYGGEAKIGLTCSLEFAEASNEWIFEVRFDASGKAEFSFGLHALWSSLWDAASAGQSEDWKTSSKKDSDRDNRKALKGVQAETRALREKALEEPPTHFQLFQLLKQLNEFVAFELEVGAQLNLTAGAGISYRWNPDTGERGVRMLSGEARKQNGKLGQGEKHDLKDFMLNLGLEAHARASISVVKADYKLAKFPSLADLDSVGASFSLDGQILGKTLPPMPKVVFPFGDGRLGQAIIQGGGSTQLVWGKSTQFSLEYFGLCQPEVKFEVRQTGSDADPVVATLPSAASTAKQVGADGKLVILLQLTSRKEPREATQVTAGGWTFTEKGVSSSVGVVDKGLGLLKGAVTSAFGGDEDDDPSIGSATPAAQFLEKLLASPNGAPLVLHGTYLSTAKRKSNPLTLLRPTLAEYRLQAKPGLLQITVQIENFLDNIVWVQLREYTKGQSSRIIQQAGESWVPVLIEQITSFGHQGRAGLLQIPLRTLQFPAAKEDVWEVYPWISLVPHKSGLLNGDLKPRNELDMERLIRVKG